MEMWPLVAVLLLRSAGGGSAQILFNAVRSIEFTTCNETVVIPCFATNVDTKQLSDLYVKWRFKGKVIFFYDGSRHRSSTPDPAFQSAEITPIDLLSGIASLKLKKSEADLGNYTCEVTELAREGETNIELKYRVVSWFSPKENILIIIFPILAILLYWGQFGVVTLKYRSDYANEKIVLLIVAGLLLTIVVVIGAILFIPAEYSTKNASGLGLIVIPMGILILLHYYVLQTAFEMTYFAIAILILQVLGFVLALVGLGLCISECTPLQGPLLISGLVIMALAQLLGPVYMNFAVTSAPKEATLQPSRKAVAKAKPSRRTP